MGTEFRAGFRTKQEKILTISFLIPSRFSYSKVHIPSYYSRHTHLRIVLLCAEVFHSSSSKFCFQLFDFAWTCGKNYCIL